MKVEDIDKLSEQEAKDLLKEFYQSPLIHTYLTLREKIDQISDKVRDADIEVGEKSFDSLIKWGEKALAINNNLEQMRSKIDTSQLLDEKERRLSAKEGSPESRRRNA